MFQCDGCMMRENLTADLRERIADRDAEIERLSIENEKWRLCREFIPSEKQEMSAEIERLRADLVWAVEHHCKHVISVVGDGIEWASPVGSIMKSVEEWDPDSICRAVRSARTGE